MFPSDNAYIFCMLYSFLITFFILDDLKLSNIKLMRYIQIIFFAIFIFYILIFMLNYYNFSLIETIYFEPISDATSGDTISDLSQNKTTKGWLDSKITHKVDLDTSIKESMKEAAEKVSKSKSIEKSSDKISNALTTGGIAGATAYVIKGSSLPPLAKDAVVVGSGAAGSLIQNASTTLKNLDKLNSEPNIAHPESPTESVTNEFQVPSPFEFFDLNKLFGVDPDNYLQNFYFLL